MRLRRGERGRDVPTVARPPTFMRPKRRKGTESVVTLGVISRMTITSSGFEGTSLDDMVAEVLSIGLVAVVGGMW